MLDGLERRQKRLREGLKCPFEYVPANGDRDVVRRSEPEDSFLLPPPRKGSSVRLEEIELAGSFELNIVSPLLSGLAFLTRLIIRSEDLLVLQMATVLVTCGSYRISLCRRTRRFSSLSHRSFRIYLRITQASLFGCLL